MSFRKLPKQKRNHLILVTFITAIALGGLGFGLIRVQYDSLRRIGIEQQQALKKLERMKDAINHGDATEAELAEVSRTLEGFEENMAAGDPYSWALDLVRRFRIAYKVEVPAVNQPIVGETTLLAKFPYKQASFTLGGTGFYHDIGKFVADFENQFPQIRIVNLTLNPTTGLANDDREKLEFKMDIIALVRPNPS